MIRSGRHVIIPDIMQVRVRAPAAARLPFYDDFNRADGAIDNGWTGATWTVSGNTAVNIPTETQRLTSNGDFTNWSGGNPVGWGVTNELAGVREVNQVGAGEGHGGVGFGKANFWRTDGTSMYITKSGMALTPNGWYHTTIVCDTVIGGTLRVGDYVTTYFDVTAPGFRTAVARAGHGSFYLLALNSTTDITVDDVTVAELTLSSLFATRDFGNANVTLSAKTIMGTGAQVGLVLNLDSPTTPANFMYAYVSAGRGRLDKCLAGTYSSVINGAITYADNKVLKVVKSGTSYSLYYGPAGSEVQVGTTQTVSDGNIVNNTNHGMFSTSPQSVLDDFAIVAT